MLTEKQTPTISVIIPCYNEQKNLERGVLDEVCQYLEGQALPWEVVIVNDESTDNSRSLIERFIQDRENCSLFDIPHGGKPAAIWEGTTRDPHSVTGAPLSSGASRPSVCPYRWKTGAAHTTGVEGS